MNREKKQRYRKVMVLEDKISRHKWAVVLERKCWSANASSNIDMRQHR